MLNDRQTKNFWKKVNKTDTCWLWTSTTRDGYGIFRVGDKMLSAHRISYQLVHGEFTGKLLHSCDVPACVNPQHLRIGTQTDNMRDMYTRGRQNRGLSNDQVVDIRHKAHEGARIQELAREYGVSRETIARAVSGKSYKHLDGKTSAWQPSKLSRSDYAEIVEALKSPYWGQSTALAKQYGVSYSLVSAIKTGKYQSVSWAKIVK